MHDACCGNQGTCTPTNLPAIKYCSCHNPSPATISAATRQAVPASKQQPSRTRGFLRSRVQHSIAAARSTATQPHRLATFLTARMGQGPNKNGTRQHLQAHITHTSCTVLCCAAHVCQHSTHNQHQNGPCCRVLQRVAACSPGTATAGRADKPLHTPPTKTTYKNTHCVTQNAC